MKTTILTLLLVFSSASILVAQQQLTLAERLGYKKTDRLLIVNADDAGMCHSANTAIKEGLEKGNITSTTIMPPCPWVNEIIDFSKRIGRVDRSFGVHLTLTSEWKNYRWSTVAPTSSVPGLIDKEGYMHRDVMPVYEHATPQQALIEGRAQIKKLIDAGVPVTHIDSHMGTYQYHIDYMRIYLQLADEFDLPARMPSEETLTRLNQPNVRKEFEARGIVMTDHFVFDELQAPEYKQLPTKEFWMKIVKNLKPGVTELFIHPNHATEEVKAITASWPVRQAEAELFTSDPDMLQLLKDEGIILISYKPLFELQRKERTLKVQRN